MRQAFRFDASTHFIVMKLSMLHHHHVIFSCFEAVQPVPLAAPNVKASAIAAPRADLRVGLLTKAPTTQSKCTRSIISEHKVLPILQLIWVLSRWSTTGLNLVEWNGVVEKGEFYSKICACVIAMVTARQRGQRGKIRSVVLVGKRSKGQGGYGDTAIRIPSVKLC